MKAYVSIIKDIDGLDLVDKVYLNKSSVENPLLKDSRVETHEVSGIIPVDHEFNKLVSSQAIEEFHFKLLQAMEAALTLKPYATAEEMVNIVRNAV